MLRAVSADLVLVVDDDVKIAQLCEAYLVRAGYRVALAHDGLTALRMIRSLSPALVVLDLMLPELDGRSVARTVREEGDVSVIMLTALGSTRDRVAGLVSGADDYVAKPFEPAELVARVGSVLRRSRSRRPSGVLRYGGFVVDAERRTATVDGRSVQLTQIEFDLLSALVAARGRILTRAQLVDALDADPAEPIQERSINVYIRRLRQKLGDEASQARSILTVRGLGYRVAEP